jgi:hypothetical protein
LPACRAVKIRAHIIYTDTSHNSRNVVYLNMYQAMLVVALKFQAYVAEWGADPRKRPDYFFREFEREGPGVGQAALTG